MHDNSDSTSRRAEEYILFALAFIGFVTAATGIIASSSGIALTGGILLLFALGCFLLGASSED